MAPRRSALWAAREMPDDGRSNLLTAAVARGRAVTAEPPDRGMRMLHFQADRGGAVRSARYRLAAAEVGPSAAWSAATALTGLRRYFAEANPSLADIAQIAGVLAERHLMLLTGSIEPHAYRANMLLWQHAPQPRQCARGRIVKHIKDGCSFADRQPDLGDSVQRRGTKRARGLEVALVP